MAKSLDWVFDFGKYVKTNIRTTLREAIENDIAYVTWCIEKVKDFELDKEARQYYEDLKAAEDDGCYDEADNWNQDWEW